MHCQLTLLASLLVFTLLHFCSASAAECDTKLPLDAVKEKSINISLKFVDDLALTRMENDAICFQVKSSGASQVKIENKKDNLAAVCITADGNKAYGHLVMSATKQFVSWQYETKSGDDNAAVNQLLENQKSPSKINVTKDNLKQLLPEIDSSANTTVKQDKAKDPAFCHDSTVYFITALKSSLTISEAQLQRLQSEQTTESGVSITPSSAATPDKKEGKVGDDSKAASALAVNVGLFAAAAAAAATAIVI